MSSLTRRIFFGVSANIVSRVTIIALNLTLTPILFRTLGKEELGLWFMLGQSGAFLGLMDLGLSPTITRWIALSKGKSGAHHDVKLNDESRAEIADIIASGAILYRFVSIGVFVVSWLLGLFFLDKLDMRTVTFEAVWIAWTVMCLSHAVGVWAGIWSCVLNGIGFVGWDAILLTVVSVLTLGTQIVAVLNGGGLITLAVIATIGGLISRYGIRYFVRRQEGVLFAAHGRWNKGLVMGMLRPAVNSWLTTLGGFMILKTDQYFIAYFKGSSEIPAYHAAYQVVTNLSNLAGAFATSSGVFISQLWQAGELVKIHELVRRNLRLGLIVMVSGVSFLVVSGKELFELWLGEGNFIGYPILITFCVMLTLEVQHFIVSSSSRATEDEVFAPWALTSGILNLFLTYYLVQKMGLLGVALGTCVAQLLTNNWYAVYRGHRRLDMDLRQHFTQVVFPVACAFILSFVAAWYAKAGLGLYETNIASMVVSFIAVSFVALVFIWFFVFDSNQRILVRSKFVRGARS